MKIGPVPDLQELPKGISENFSRNMEQDLFVMETKEETYEKENFQPAEMIEGEERIYQIADMNEVKKCRKIKSQCCPSGRTKRSKLCQHFSAKEGAPNKATCNHCSKELSKPASNLEKLLQVRMKHFYLTIVNKIHNLGKISLLDVPEI